MLMADSLAESRKTVRASSFLGVVIKSKMFIYNIVAILSVVNVMNEKTTFARIMKEIDYGDITEPKTIVVHGKLYKRLLVEKGYLLLEGKVPATFENAIIANMNKANNLAVLVNRLIRKHPEIRESLTEISKEISEDVHQQIAGMLKSIKNE